MIRDLDFFTHPKSQVPDPGVTKAPGHGSQIRIRNTAQMAKIRCSLKDQYHDKYFLEKGGENKLP